MAIFSGQFCLRFVGHAESRALLVLLLACLSACGNKQPREPRDAAAVAVEDAAATAGDAAPRRDDAGSVRPASDASTPRERDAGPASDSAVVDAGTPRDAATPPAPSDGGERTYSKNRDEFFGAPRCTGSSFLLCEDFESESPGSKADSALWSTTDQRIVVDATRAARGAHSLKVSTNSSEGTHFIRTSKFVASAQDKHWGRLFFWVAAPRPGKFSHWTVIEGTGVHPAGGTARIRFGGIHVPGVENRLDFNYDIWGGRPSGFHEVGYELVGQDTKDGMWHCLEWTFDIPGREARLFRDGNEETKLHASKTIDNIALDFPKLDGLNIGMAIYQDIGGDSWNVWIDEIAVDSKRIGCSF